MGFGLDRKLAYICATKIINFYCMIIEIIQTRIFKNFLMKINESHIFLYFFSQNEKMNMNFFKIKLIRSIFIFF